MKYWPDLRNQLAKKTLLMAALAGVLLMCQGGGIAQNSPVVSNDEAFKRVSNRLSCQCSCPYLVSSCNMVDCSSATYIRKTIQTSLAAGKSEDAIVASFVEQYGPRILSEPPQKGFSLTAWIMPFAMLLLGGAVITYVLWQWKLKSSLAPAGGAAGVPSGPASQDQQPTQASALVEKYRARIDRELEKE